MVVLILTKEGFEEMEPIIVSGSYPVWVGSGVLTKEHLDYLRDLSLNITNFNCPINLGSREEVDDALETILEHHPGERVWVERIS